MLREQLSVKNIAGETVLDILCRLGESDSHLAMILRSILLVLEYMPADMYRDISSSCKAAYGGLIPQLLSLQGESEKTLKEIGIDYVNISVFYRIRRTCRSQAYFGYEGCDVFIANGRSFY